MDCQTSKEHISQFLDDELSRELLPSLFQHLGDCEECRNFFVQTKLVHDTVKKMKYAAVPEDLDEKFAVLGMEEKKEPLMARKFTLSLPSAILSGFLVFIISIIFILFIGDIQTKIQFDEQKPEAEYFRPATLQMPYYN